MFKFPNTPVSGTAKEWRLWEEKARREHPGRWFIQKTLWEHGILRKLQHLALRFRDLKWAILHRWHPKHRHHWVDTGLAPGWHDPRTQILHASFHTFKRFYEQQLTGHVDWQGDAHHQAAWAEMTALYQWWVTMRPAREAQLGALPTGGVLEKDFMVVFDDDFQQHPEVIEWRRIAALHHEAERQWAAEDEEMLLRLVKIRPFLWD